MTNQEIENKYQQIIEAIYLLTGGKNGSHYNANVESTDDGDLYLHIDFSETSPLTNRNCLTQIIEMLESDFPQFKLSAGYVSIGESGISAFRYLIIFPEESGQ